MTMNRESYTPGHGANATDFMARRSLQSHGEFFLDQLAPGLSVLDCGCGPGSITIDIAKHVVPGSVVGIDLGATQIERAKANAAATGVRNVTFQSASCYTLPFEDNSFDRVFSHALMEHLSDPLRALKECWRVLKPRGVIGVCSPDWGGFVLSPPSSDLDSAISAYVGLQSRNGGDVGIGRKLGAYLTSAGFADVWMSARFESYPDREVIGEYLAVQLDREGEAQAAEVLRAWSKSAGGLFAQAWIAAVARKPPTSSQ
jgi:SAM-dependent methyltransferase